ncbi:DUF2490 domain-containing protein [Echinicola sp. 20G]|uniref:DUF2490 domain-containing protein n=1 Tax=Echinicola sp. 20G TaxID=2781961 RepID=UPI0019102FB0|nr:DUF2490 domain-containing protein [Echinicola sp. 20G]
MLFTFISSGFSQQKETIHENQQWLQYYNKLHFAEKWSLATDLGLRFKNGFDKKTRYIARTGLIYHLSNKFQIAAGFARLGSYYQGKEVKVIETRPFQSLSMKHHHRQFNLVQRLSMEERSFKNINSDTPLSTDITLRLRYRLMFNVPLTSFNSGSSTKKISLNFGNELFLNANNDIAVSTFDQNRVILGPAIQLNKSFKASIIYQYQYSSTPIENTYKQTSILRMNLKHNLDLRN